MANKRFHKKNKRTSHMHKLCDILTDKGTCTVVFGAAGGHTGIKGCKPGGPMKEFQSLIRKKNINVCWWEKV